jgi:hypothetical protein
MKIRTSFVIAAAVVALGWYPSLAAAQFVEVPPMPAELEVPAGHSLFLHARAIGTQNYVCVPNGSAFTWKQFAPEATLFLTISGEPQMQVTTHFLSANPREGGTPRPTWQSSFDTSRVWARAIATSTDANYVAPGAIPWLKLQTAGVEEGPTGGTFLSQTSFIQRLNTSGGIAPATGCAQASQIGSIALVPYSTDYFFYRPGRQ